MGCEIERSTVQVYFISKDNEQGRLHVLMAWLAVATTSHGDHCVDRAHHAGYGQVLPHADRLGLAVSGCPSRGCNRSWMLVLGGSYAGRVWAAAAGPVDRRKPGAPLTVRSWSPMGSVTKTQRRTPARQSCRPTSAGCSTSTLCRRPDLEVRRSDLAQNGTTMLGLWHNDSRVTDNVAVRQVMGMRAGLQAYDDLPLVPQHHGSTSSCSMPALMPAPSSAPRASPA